MKIVLSYIKTALYNIWRSNCDGKRFSALQYAGTIYRRNLSHGNGAVFCGIERL